MAPMHGDDFETADRPDCRSQLLASRSCLLPPLPPHFRDGCVAGGAPRR